MKKLKKHLLIFIIIISGLLFPISSYGANIDNLGKITGGNNNIISGGNSSMSSTVENVGIKVLSVAKNIFGGVLLIIIVYAGAQMIMSMGSDEEQLSTAKRTLLYSIVGVFFINMPGTIYNAVRGDRISTAGGVGSSWSNDISSTIGNLFINTDVFAATINSTVITFLKVVLVGVAIVVIILAGIKIMTSRGREDQVSEGKEKILWALVGLVFIGFIESWQRFAYTGNIPDGRDIFETMANLALFLAVPTTLFFLTLAGYYFITSAGDEEKTKKGKNIIINTLIAIAILLISFVFLYDLISI